MNLNHFSPNFQKATIFSMWKIPSFPRCLPDPKVPREVRHGSGSTLGGKMSLKSLKLATFHLHDWNKKECNISQYNQNKGSYRRWGSRFPNGWDAWNKLHSSCRNLVCPHFLWRRWLRYVAEGFCSFRFCATVFFFCLFVFQWSTLGNVKMVVLVNGTPEIPWVFFSITSKLFVKVRLGSSISRRAYLGQLSAVLS